MRLLYFFRSFFTGRNFTYHQHSWWFYNAYSATKKTPASSATFGSFRFQEKELSFMRRTATIFCFMQRTSRTTAGIATSRLAFEKISINDAKSVCKSCRDYNAENSRCQHNPNTSFKT